MDVASLYVFPVFIVFEIIQILTLKKELSVLKSDKQTFATSSSTERIELFLYSETDKKAQELEKKLMAQIASNDRYIKRLKNRLQKSRNLQKWEALCKSDLNL